MQELILFMNMTSGKLENLSFTDGFRWSRYSGRYRLQKDRSETLSGKVRRSAETSMDLTQSVQRKYAGWHIMRSKKKSESSKDET